EAAFLAAVLLGGCGTDDSARYPVSGTVTIGGKAVPVGEVVFEPDSSRGNNGPGSVAQIKDGRYGTGAKLGVVGGPYIVRITPFDGVSNQHSSGGKPLLRAPYVVCVEFPSEKSSHDFDIPVGGRR